MRAKLTCHGEHWACPRLEWPRRGCRRERQRTIWSPVTAGVIWSGLSLLPDADVIGFRFGVRYEDTWGHRGATHSLTFALGVGISVVHRAPDEPGSRSDEFDCGRCCDEPLNPGHIHRWRTGLRASGHLATSASLHRGHPFRLLPRTRISVGRRSARRCNRARGVCIGHFAVRDLACVTSGLVQQGVRRTRVGRRAAPRDWTRCESSTCPLDRPVRECSGRHSRSAQMQVDTGQSSHA